VGLSVNTGSLKALFLNPIFLSTACTLCTAQVLKTLIFILSGRRGKAKELIEITIWRTGGMPSSHAAVVAALTTSVAFLFFKEGVEVNLFVFSFWFMLVVIRDALGVRRAAGLQARALNNLGRQIADKMNINFNPVKEIQGHTPLEVAVGILLGIFIAAGFALL
jgi:acid phosphatase family membrane protein YuiD